MAHALLCDVSELAADAVTIDVLARLALAARRRGHRLRLRGVSLELRTLIAFVGLEEVLVEVGGETEQGE